MFSRQLRSAKLKTNAVVKKESDHEESAPVSSTKRSECSRRLRSAKIKEYPSGTADGKLNSKSGNKFFKKKAANSNKESTPENVKVPLRKKQNVKRTKRIRKNDSSLDVRQMTLTDLFSAHAVSERLRPRRKLKNYCEESKLIEKHISPQKRNSVVFLENLNELGGRKAPIYKSVRMSEEHVKDQNEIYDFKFDINDSKEKLVNKKKHKVSRRPTVKRVKKCRTANPTLKNTNKVGDIKLNASNKVAKKTKKVKILTDRADSYAKDDIATRSNNDACENKQKLKSTETTKQRQTLSSLRTPLTDNAQNIIQKPRIISVTMLEKNEKFDVVSTPSLPKITIENSKPSQVTNLINSQSTMQHKDIGNHSLFNKSLSPISNVVTSFDPGSPWRPPTLNVFSQIGHIYQSTPREQQRTGVIKKTTPITANGKMPILRAEKNNVLKENNENVNIEIVQAAISPKKKSFTTRPLRTFGTEISNMNHPKLLKTNLSSGTSDNLLLVDYQPVVGISKSLSDTQEFSACNENTENKENTIPNSQTSKKSPKKNSKQINTSSHICLLEKELGKPVPGPSGLQKKNTKLQAESSDFQKHDLISKSMILKQSNLNNFLNLDEIPQSSQICTPHGIFDDAYLTPIQGKTVRKVQREADIQTAFGFNDECSDNEISPIVSNDNSTTPLKKVIKETIEKVNDLQEQKVKSTSKPTRLSNGEVKTTLLPMSSTKTFDEDAQIEKKRKNAEEFTTDKQKEIADSINFSNTFDINSKSRKSSDKEISSELPLFVDLEPMHFTKPPRHSYHGKRPLWCSFSEDEDEGLEEGEICRKPKTKKKRAGYLSKVEERRLQEWVKSINDTFQEVDQHSLVIE